MAGIPLKRIIQDIGALSWVDKASVNAMAMAHLQAAGAVPGPVPPFGQRLRSSCTRNRSLYDMNALPKHPFYVSFQQPRDAVRQTTMQCAFKPPDNDIVYPARGTMMTQHLWHKNRAFCDADEHDEYKHESAEVFFSSSDYGHCGFGARIELSRMECGIDDRIETADLDLHLGQLVLSAKAGCQKVLDVHDNEVPDLQPSIAAEMIRQFSLTDDEGALASESSSALLYTSADLAPVDIFSIPAQRRRGRGAPSHGETIVTALVNGIELYSLRVPRFAFIVQAQMWLYPEAWEDATSITSHGLLTWSQHHTHTADLSRSHLNGSVLAAPPAAAAPGAAAL